MEKNKSAAANIRIRYLMEEVVRLSALDNDVADGYIVRYLDEVIYLVKQAEVTYVPQSTSYTQLTQQDIDFARDYPVDKLIRFTRGKAKCISGTHDDKNPSMFHGTRMNRAVCPACNSSWSPIDIVMKQQGLGWHDAVRSLLM